MTGKGVPRKKSFTTGLCVAWPSVPSSSVASIKAEVIMGRRAKPSAAERSVNHSVPPVRRSGFQTARSRKARKKQIKRGACKIGRRKPVFLAP
jgi:hypothetical protein